MPLDVIKGEGYRIGTSARPTGQPSTAPDGFVVLDLRSNTLYVVVSGVWTLGTFPSSDFTQNNFDTWLLC